LLISSRVMFSRLISEGESYPHIIYYRFFFYAERPEEFCAAQHESIALIACGVIHLDPYVESKDQEREVKAKSEPSSNTEFPIEPIPFEFGVAIGDRLFVDAFYPRLKRPDVPRIQKHGAIDETE